MSLKLIFPLSYYIYDIQLSHVVIIANIYFEVYNLSLEYLFIFVTTCVHVLYCTESHSFNCQLVGSLSSPLHLAHIKFCISQPTCLRDPQSQVKR